MAFKVGSPRVLKQQGNMNNLNLGKNILGTKNRKKYLGSWEQNNANERKKKGYINTKFQTPRMARSFYMRASPPSGMRFYIPLASFNKFALVYNFSNNTATSLSAPSVTVYSLNLLSVTTASFISWPPYQTLLQLGLYKQLEFQI